MHTSDSMYGRYLHHKKYGTNHYEYKLKRSSYLDSVSDSSSAEFPQPNALNLDLDRPDVKESDEFRRFPNGLIYSEFNNFKSILSMLFVLQMMLWKIWHMLISQSHRSHMRSCENKTEMPMLRRQTINTVVCPSDKTV